MNINVLLCLWEKFDRIMHVVQQHSCMYILLQWHYFSPNAILLSMHYRV